MTDLVKRLREPILTEEVMKRWDYVRNRIASGSTASHPRDIIEADLDGWDEARREAADTIEALQAENAKMRAIISALEKYQAGEPSEPPRTGRPKTTLTTREKPE